MRDQPKASPPHSEPDLYSTCLSLARRYQPWPITESPQSDTFLNADSMNLPCHQHLQVISLGDIVHYISLNLSTCHRDSQREAYRYRPTNNFNCAGRILESTRRTRGRDSLLSRPGGLSRSGVGGGPASHVVNDVKTVRRISARENKVNWESRVSKHGEANPCLECLRDATKRLKLHMQFVQDCRGTRGSAGELGLEHLTVSSEREDMEANGHQCRRCPSRDGPTNHERYNSQYYYYELPTPRRILRPTIDRNGTTPGPTRSLKVSLAPGSGLASTVRPGELKHSLHIRFLIKQCIYAQQQHQQLSSKLLTCCAIDWLRDKFGNVNKPVGTQPSDDEIAPPGYVFNSLPTTRGETRGDLQQLRITKSVLLQRSDRISPRLVSCCCAVSQSQKAFVYIDRGPFVTEYLMCDISHNRK
ncbi:hypothetical protein RRG08_025643 [Elysia crispata]|uniref:Uncharacterized protein n=1 Tax=Elysia crispata TaxID=231223 RepID=A0AAE0YEC6_9GAST|nr:hypothetical protein RRG08_025643 [Elysia crispata]